MILLRGLRTLIVGAVLNLTAVSSILVLGWLMRMMRRQALAAVDRRARRATWLRGHRDAGLFRRSFGGLGANIREGFAAAAALFLATFPFAGFWLVAWWAGWDNSFNKGYEQAFVGPAVGLLGVAIFAVIMLWLPMGLAHQATEARAWALFELRRVRSAVRHAGWGQLGWGIAMLVAALPVFAVRGLPAFAEGIYPQLADMRAEDVAALRLGIDLATGVYVMAALVVLKGWSARIYARAATRAASGRDELLWQGAMIGPGQDDRRPWAVFHWLRTVLLLAIWVGFAFLIFFGQFLNHSWWSWLNHPLIFLPWTP